MAEQNLRLLIDFGSTFTKLVIVDLNREDIIHRVQAPSTVENDITIGLRQVLGQAQEEIGFKDLPKDSLLACSSAAGGLRMISIGLVPSLSCEAGVRAALGAGAKVVRSFSYGLTLVDMVEIEKIAPDIILLAGGTDGGNKQVILHNAEMLANSTCTAPIVVAGNKRCQGRNNGSVQFLWQIDNFCSECYARHWNSECRFLQGGYSTDLYLPYHESQGNR